MEEIDYHQEFETLDDAMSYAQELLEMDANVEVEVYFNEHGGYTVEAVVVN